jgi:hypothetical protein
MSGEPALFEYTAVCTGCATERRVLLPYQGEGEPERSMICRACSARARMSVTTGHALHCGRMAAPRKTGGEDERAR